jgi:triacylglycerol esterase/lipase EstA (alpha/beta hydrolase family)
MREGRRLLGGARISIATLVAAVLCAGLAGMASADQENPLQESPGISPPGANDFSCKPPARHPHPVVLVHGTFGDMTVSWNLISPALAQKGYCVFALDYGKRATQRIQDSAAELRRFVNKVRRATGARKVSIVGHSQGGMMPRYYIKFLGGARRVADLVGLAPSNHGTTTPLARPAGEYGSCPACVQQIAGSRFLRHLNAGDETPGHVSYTQIETSHDEVVTPFKSAFLKRGPRTTNVLLQHDCPLDLSEHLSVIYDPVALQWVNNALARRGPANPDFEPTCL